MKECPHCRELAEDNADVCLNCGWKFGSEEEVLRNNDIYEYDVRYVIDQPTGEEDTETIKALMNEYAAKGWRLHTVYVNELGKSAVSMDIGETTGGSNSTIDQTILVFERVVRRKH